MDFKNCDYKLINTKEKLNDMIKVFDTALATSKNGSIICSIDLETSGLSIYEDYIVGIGLSLKQKTGNYIPLNHDIGVNLDYDETLSTLKPYLENPAIQYVAHGRKFDQSMLGASYLDDDFFKLPNYVTDLWLSIFTRELNLQDYSIFKRIGINCTISYDTMSLAYLTGKYANVGSGMSTASLKKIVAQELGVDMVEITELFGVKKGSKTTKKIKFHTLDPEQEIALEDGTLVMPYQYGCADVDYTLQLLARFHTQLQERQFLSQVDYGIIPLVKLMELNGVLCNIPEMQRQFDYLSKELEKLQQTIFRDVEREAGKPEGTIVFDLKSAAQVGKILFDTLGYPVAARSEKTKKPLTNAKVLGNMAKNFPVVSKILVWRGIRKAANDFLSGMQNYINKDTGRIHTSYATYHVITRRFASEDPNMQNQPKSSKTKWHIQDIAHPDGGYDIAVNVRKCYIAPDDFYMIEGDFSQVEYRVFAALSGARTLMEGYANGIDMHTKNASMIFQIPEADITKDLRQKGKAYSFGIMFGMKAPSIANDTGCTVEEAQINIDNYFRGIPEGVAYISNIISQAVVDGYVDNYFGGRAYIPELHGSNYKLRAKAEREAFNCKIQGTAADIMRLSLYRLTQALIKKWGYRFNDFVKPILTTHDSFCLLVHRSVDPRAVMSVMRESCEIELKGFPDIVMDFSLGLNYGELVEWDDIKDSFDTSKKDYGFDDFYRLKEERKKEADNLKAESREQNNPSFESNSIPIQGQYNINGYIQNNHNSSTVYQKPNSVTAYRNSTPVGEAKPQIIRIYPKSNLNESQVIDLKNLLESNPGVNICILNFTDSEIPMEKFPTSLSFTDKERFNVIFPCEVTMDKNSISSRALSDGIKF